MGGGIAHAVSKSFAIAVMVLAMVEKKVRISERVKHFRFVDAKCFSEDDRSTVQRNIIAFMKFHGHVDTEASDTQIIQQFEAMVHSEVPKLFAASLGRVGLPFQFAVCASLPYGLQSVDYACAQFHNGESARVICIQLAFTMTMVCAVIPVSHAVGFLLAEYLIRKPFIGYKLRVLILAPISL